MSKRWYSCVVTLPVEEQEEFLEWAKQQPADVTVSWTYKARRYHHPTAVYYFNTKVRNLIPYVKLKWGKL